MKTILTILLCLLPWAVEAQYELPCTSSVVLPYIHGADSVLMDGPMPYTRKSGEVVLIYGRPVPPDSSVLLTRADVARMIEETVKARIDSALAAQGRWVQVIKEVWIYNRHNNGGMTCVGHDCRDSAQECHWRVDTTWVWTRPEGDKP